MVSITLPVKTDYHGNLVMVIEGDENTIRRAIAQIKDQLKVEVSFNQEYGSGGSKRLSVQLFMGNEQISEDAVYITEGKWESSW